MEGVLAAIEAAPLIAAIRTARWGYAALNGAHVLGIALLVGAMVPLNLVRMGLGPVPQQTAGRLLVPFAATGLAVAVTTGALMFATRAAEYAALDVLRLKVALVVAGAATALVLHARYGQLMERASPAWLKFHAAVSLALWLVVLALGRTIAFVG